MAGTLPEVGTAFVTGANVGIFLGVPGTLTEIPIIKFNIKKTIKKTDGTGSTSIANGQVWEEFSPGVSGGTLNFDGHWRVGQNPTPPYIRQGAVYLCNAYVVKPNIIAPGDPGSFYSGNILIDDQDITFDTKLGTLDYKFVTTFTGPITHPQ